MIRYVPKQYMQVFWSVFWGKLDIVELHDRNAYAYSVYSLIEQHDW